MEEKEKQNCLKELKRLKRHYKKEYKSYEQSKGISGYLCGVMDGLDLAIHVLENSKFYGKSRKCHQW